MSSSMYTRLRALAHHLYPTLRTAKMSTVHNTNAACCTIPPVKSDYVPKGKFKSYAGFNTVGGLLTVPRRSLTIILCNAGLCHRPRDPWQVRARLRL